MELKPNMYVRTDTGIIGKIYEQIGDMFTYKDSNRDYITYGFLHNEILKASHSIIDLIEVGDYVNGYYVSKIWEENEITHYVDETPIKRKERQITIQAPSYGGIIHLKNDDIKSKVTKEQFEKMQYSLEG